MATTMQFDLVSPERSLMSAQVVAVQIPGAEGDMTAMPDHAPVITTLRPGVLKVEEESGTTEFVVTGGFAELGAGLSVLAEQAVPLSDVDQATYERMVAELQTAYEQTKASADTGTGVADAAKALNDMASVASQIGLSVKTPAL